MGIFCVDRDEYWPFYDATPADEADSYQLRFHKPMQLTDEEAQLVREAKELLGRAQELLGRKWHEEET